MYKRMAPLTSPLCSGPNLLYSPKQKSVLTTLFTQCPGPPTLLFYQERRICRNPLLADRRPLISLQLEHQTSLRIRVSLMAKCDIHGVGERGGYLGHDYYEPERRSFGEYWARGNEEVG